MGDGILEVSSPWEYESICPFSEGNGRTTREIFSDYWHYIIIICLCNRVCSHGGHTLFA